jgi:hypothetical protein
VGDGGFGMALAMTGALHLCEIYDQFLIKKRRLWPKDVLGDLINNYMSQKHLGETESYVQTIDDVHFFVHFCENHVITWSS